MIQKSLFFDAGTQAVLEVGGPEQAYPTTIEDVRADSIAILSPVRKMETVEVDVGQTVLIRVDRRNSPYFFETQVVAKAQGEGGRALLWLRRPADTAGKALREFVRVPVVISDLQYWIEEDDKFGATHKGQILDISAGGCLIMTREKLPIDAVLLLKFTLPKPFGQFMLNATVRSSYERASDTGVHTFRAGSQFVDVVPKDRDRLIKFVFQRERELRQKGVL